MKTKPDDITLTQWMDGELEGEPLRQVEAWAQTHPELLAERDAVQAMSASIRAHVPESVEPPYPDFFNQRILRTIEEDQMAVAAPQTGRLRETSPSFWQWLAMPLAAGAMAVCFYLGTQVSNEPASPTTPMVATAPSANSSVYTPDGDVQANMFKSADAQATVIVLEGLDDIPDDFEMAGEPLIESSKGMMIKTDQSHSTF